MCATGLCVSVSVSAAAMWGVLASALGVLIKPPFQEVKCIAELNWCSTVPLPADITPGPDGQYYRWCSKVRAEGPDRTDCKAKHTSTAAAAAAAAPALITTTACWQLCLCDTLSGY